jgi:hypothetical protein
MFKVYIGGSLSFAATAKRCAVYTSFVSESEVMTPRPTKKKALVQIPSKMHKELAAVNSQCVQSMTKLNGRDAKSRIVTRELSSSALNVMHSCEL